MPSDQTPNPYESPAGIETQPSSWFDILRNLFARRPPRSPVERFLHGESAIHYGVVFRLNPQDKTTLSAALPLGGNDDEHVRRNVIEAQRTLHKLLARYPELSEPLHGRVLVISLISEYGPRAEELQRVIVPPDEWEHWVEEDDLDDEPLAPQYDQIGPNRAESGRIDKRFAMINHF